MRDEDAWRQLGSHDERAAQHAFDHLHKSYLSFGQRVVRRKFSDCQTEDIENAVQQAFLNLWQSRQRLQVADLPSWCGLLSKTACNCYFDILRARRPLLSLDDPHGIPWDEISSDEISFLLEILESLDRAATIGRLMEAADVCWLGLSPARPTEERTRRLLAAKLFYIEGAETEEILALLNRARPGQRPLTPTVLTEWLEDPETLLHLAYKTLYVSPAALTAHLLGLEPETQPSELDALLLGKASEETLAAIRPDWTPEAIHIILWKYYRNANPQGDTIIPQSDLTLEQISAIIGRCRTLFPFGEQMDALRRSTAGRLETLCGPSHPGLWRRLAFQYRYLDDLTHQDIEDRIAPAARQVGFPISQTVLQGWLSSKRLLQALAKACADLFEEYNHE